jgi:hypothetical protein
MANGAMFAAKVYILEVYVVVTPFSMGISFLYFQKYHISKMRFSL